LYHRLKDRLPLCVEEGLAVSAEGFHISGETVAFQPRHNPGRYAALRKLLVNGQFIPIDKLLPMNASEYLDRGTEYSVGWYGQVWALSLFLRSSPKYRDGFARALADAQAGRFHLALEMSAADLNGLQRSGGAYNKTLALPLFRHYVTPDLKTFDREFRAFANKLVELEDPPL
jgi:hypothetical protein